jgi:uncharacterized membrane protein YqiK
MIDAERIDKEQEIQRLEILRQRALEIEEQERVIAIAEKSREQYEAQRAAEIARAAMVESQERVALARDKEAAERRKLIDRIEAEQVADREAIKLTVLAAAEKKAAEERAEATRVTAEAARVRYEVDADGQRKLNEAENVRSDAARRSGLARKLVDALPDIIRESVKPIESIESIRILQVDGLPGFSGGNAANGGPGDDSSPIDPEQGGRSGSLADNAVNAALRYRAQAPFVDELLKHIGMSPNSMGGLSGLLKDSVTTLGDGAKPPLPDSGKQQKQ